MILGVKTDQPEAYIALIDGNNTYEYIWQARRELSDTLLVKTNDLLQQQSVDITQLNGIVVFAGPGSFTGLRIGASTANALAYSLGIPIVGAMGETWQQNGVEKLANGHDEKVVNLTYGSAPHITTPRK
jgi:tRNA threonylcarbamoyladenosine biosynthesis protein TsaB